MFQEEWLLLDNELGLGHTHLFLRLSAIFASLWHWVNWWSQMPGTHPCTHILCIMLTIKVNHSTIQTPAHHSWGMWPYSKGEQQVSPFSCRSLTLEQMLLSTLIYSTRGAIATIKANLKRRKVSPKSPTLNTIAIFIQVLSICTSILCKSVLIYIIKSQRS